MGESEVNETLDTDEDDNDETREVLREHQNSRATDEDSVDQPDEDIQPGTEQLERRREDMEELRNVEELGDKSFNISDISFTMTEKERRLSDSLLGLSEGEDEYIELGSSLSVGENRLRRRVTSEDTHEDCSLPNSPGLDITLGSGVERPKTSCMLCQVSLNRKSLGRHLRNVHQRDAAEVTEILNRSLERSSIDFQDVLTSDEPDEDDTNHGSTSYNDHTLARMSEKRVAICGVCGIKVNSDEIVRHMRNVHEEKQPRGKSTSPAMAPSTQRSFTSLGSKYRLSKLESSSSLMSKSHIRSPARKKRMRLGAFREFEARSVPTAGVDQSILTDVRFGSGSEERLLDRESGVNEAEEGGENEEISGADHKVGKKRNRRNSNEEGTSDTSETKPSAAPGPVKMTICKYCGIQVTKKNFSRHIRLRHSQPDSAPCQNRMNKNKSAI